MTQILNLTPHDIHIVDEDGNVTHTFPKSGQVVRLDISTVVVDNDGIPTVKRQESLDVSTVPNLGVSLGVIVSAQVASHIVACREEAQLHIHRYNFGDEITDWYPFPSHANCEEVASAFSLEKIFTVGDTVKDSNGAIIGTRNLVLN